MPTSTLCQTRKLLPTTRLGSARHLCPLATLTPEMPVSSLELRIFQIRMPVTPELPQHEGNLASGVAHIR